jgi:hypothetical protein
MSILPIGSEQILGNSVRATSAEAQPQAARAPVKSANAQTAPEYVVSVRSETADFARLQEIKAGTNKLALSVKTADNTMAQIDDYLKQMNVNLDGIVKQFPPYPPGSEDRVRLLKSYSALRALINRLTVPSENNGEKSIVSQQTAAAIGSNTTDGPQEAVFNP